jgi:hypothetical protein
VLPNIPQMRTLVAGGMAGQGGGLGGPQAVLNWPGATPGAVAAKWGACDGPARSAGYDLPLPSEVLRIERSRIWSQLRSLAWRNGRPPPYGPHLRCGKRIKPKRSAHDITSASEKANLRLHSGWMRQSYHFQ